MTPTEYTKKLLDELRKTPHQRAGISHTVGETVVSIFGWNGKTIEHEVRIADGVVSARYKNTDSKTWVNYCSVLAENFDPDVEQVAKQIIGV